jgi:hypothetical protein
MAPGLVSTVFPLQILQCSEVLQWPRVYAGVCISGIVRVCVCVCVCVYVYVYVCVCAGVQVADALLG